MNTELQKQIDAGLIVEYCTEPLTGQKLYQFTKGGGNMYADRASSLIALIEAQNKYQLDAEEIKLRIGAMRSIRLQQTVSAEKRLMDIDRLLAQIEDMYECSTPMNLYWIGAGLLMDETENPLIFDSNYQKQKIGRWAKDPLMFPFLSALQPFLGLDFSQGYLNSTLTYLQEMETILKMRGVSNLILQKVLGSYGTMERKDGDLKSIEWLAETYLNMSESVSYLTLNLSGTEQTG